jgi:hypothetical protein
MIRRRAGRGLLKRHEVNPQYSGFQRFPRLTLENWIDILKGYGIRFCC